MLLELFIFSAKITKRKLMRTFCKKSANNCQSVERSILGNLWRSIQARYGCEKLFHTPALTKSDVAPALRIWIEVGEALNWRGCRMSRNAWGSPPMWTTHQSLTENCELLFSSGMRNPCVTFVGPFILFWWDLVSVELSACEPTDWGLLPCVHEDDDLLIGLISF